MEILNEYSNQLSIALKKIDSTGFKNIQSFIFNTSYLVDFVDRESSTKCKIWDSFWKEYNLIIKPVVYWFEITSETNNHLIFESMTNYKRKNERSVPAIKKNFSVWDTKTMYVGCCSKTKFRDRIHQHFGYYVEGRTQGLQLCHWAKMLSLDIKLNFFQLPEEAIDLTTLFEKKLAERLQPLFGKHQ